MKPDAQTLQDVLDTALKDIAFFNELIEDPQAALKNHEFELSPPEMKVLLDLLSRKTVLHLRDALTSICQDLRINSPDPPVIRDTWKCPEPREFK